MPSLLLQAASGISSESSCWQRRAITGPAVPRSAVRAIVWKSVGRGSVVMATTSIGSHSPHFTVSEDHYQINDRPWTRTKTIFKEYTLSVIALLLCNVNIYMLVSYFQDASTRGRRITTVTCTAGVCPCHRTRCRHVNGRVSATPSVRG